MTIAFSYIRFSSKKQELGDSLLRQTRLAREYADKHGLTLDNRSYTDLGVSAFKGKNKVEGALGALLQCIDEGKIPKGSYLLVESLDRVSREEVLSALDTFLSIIKRDIVLVTLLDGAVFTRENINENWTKLIAALAVIARANEESATKAKRVKEAWDAKRAAGEILTAIGPAWLKLSDDRKKWLEVPEKVFAVQRAFELAAMGLGAPTIADTLNKEQITTMGRAEFWEPALVLALLKNTSVIGTYTPKKAKTAEPIEGYYPAIIKTDVFYQVQEHIANRRHTGGRKGENVANLFSGILQCECGSRMRYVSANKPHLYLQCVKAYSGQGCDAPTMPYNVIEEKILWWMLVFEGFDFGMNKKVVADPLAPLRVELEQKQKLIQKMIEALNMSEAASLPTLVTNMARLENEAAALKKQINEYVAPMPSAQAFQEAFELFKQHKDTQPGTVERTELRERLRAALKRLIHKMVLYKATHANVQGVYYRNLALYGPVTEVAKQSDYGDIWEYTEDGGLIQDYELPAWGINGTRKRAINVIVDEPTKSAADTIVNEMNDPVIYAARSTRPSKRTPEQIALLERVKKNRNA